MKTTVYLYTDQLLGTSEENSLSTDSAWLTVPSKWVGKRATQRGYHSLEDFLSNYTYDDTIGWVESAIEEDVLIDCGVNEHSHTVTEWCSNCENEVELPRARKWYECPSCDSRIAPCAQFSHGEEETLHLPVCVCMEDE